MSLKVGKQLFRWRSVLQAGIPPVNISQLVFDAANAGRPAVMCADGAIHPLAGYHTVERSGKLSLGVFSQVDHKDVNGTLRLRDVMYKTAPELPYPDRLQITSYDGAGVSTSVVEYALTYDSEGDWLTKTRIA